MIRLSPYKGGNLATIGALLEELQMNVYFDDVTDCDTCYFCYQADEESSLVDYEISWEDLDAWHAGAKALELRELPHDPEHFADDLAVIA